MRKKIKYKVNNNGCWICTSHALSSGYPVIVRGKRLKKISRIMYKKYKGRIPEGMVIRHTCDNPACINPAHLIKGTQSDNMRDKKERGRSTRGEKSERTELTDKQVLEIFKNPDKPIKYYMKKYNTTYTAIVKILDGTNWKHLQPKSFRKKDRKKKLTKRQREEIIKSKESGVVLAKRYNVSEALISIIRKKKCG